MESDYRLHQTLADKLAEMLDALGFEHYAKFK